jgi:hypothetical protein
MDATKDQERFKMMEPELLKLKAVNTGLMVGILDQWQMAKLELESITNSYLF